MGPSTQRDGRGRLEARRRWLGPEGEKLYGKRNFAELCAVFSTPRFIVVRWDQQDVGTVDAAFLETLDSDTRWAAFSLAGRAWEIVHVDWKKGVCTVRPSDHATVARWSGSPGFLGYERCQAMRRVLLSDHVDPVWSRRAREHVAASREEYAFLADSRTPMVRAKGEITWWTFARGGARILLARLIESEIGGKCVVRNTSISCRDEAALSVGRLEDFARALAARSGPSIDDARRFAASCAGRGRLSKFVPCFPEALLNEYVADRALDVEGARVLVAGG